MLVIAQQNKFWQGEEMLKKQYFKNILSALAVIAFGFILLNLTFILDAAFQSLLNLFIPINKDMTMRWYLPARHILFAVLIYLLSWFILKSKIRTIYKAIFSVVPVAVTFVTIGMFLYQWPVVSYILSALIYGGIFFYFYKTKKQWIYYFSVSLIAVVLLITGIMGMEI